MGNICPWCKTSDDSQSDNNLRDGSAITNSQHSVTSSEVNDRTPLLSKSSSHNQYHQPVTSVVLNPPTNVEPSSLFTSVVPPPPLPLLNSNHTEATTAKISSNETAESSMAIIVERMLPDLIDVGGWGTGAHQTNTNTQHFNAQNDQLKQLLSKSLQASRVSSFLPDAGTANLSSLLSSRPISSDICHFVAHTASELSRFLIDEIKIVHKEDLVVTFE